MVKPLLDKPPQIKRKETGRITMTRNYELITPLFGGGVRTNEVDIDNPIRGTAVRGHLRFWWRATRGGQFGKDGLAAMKAREDEIWGSSAKAEKGEKRPLPVQIAIRIDKYGSPDEPFTHEANKKGVVKPTPNKKSSVPAYAAFPLQRTDEEIKAKKPPYTVQKNIAFTLEIDFPGEYREDVETTLWAWETFGGIGARTRRGFGALHCTEVKENGQPKSLPAPKCDAVTIKQAIKDRLNTITDDWPENVPHLSPKMFLEIVNREGNAETAWKWLVDKLRAFRQSREGNEYGPTHWPEANAVRLAAGKNASSKSPSLGPKFPRAQLGLPIIFHFPQEGNLDDATLSGVTKERLASQLILRPLSCGHNRAVALAAVLIGPAVPEGGIALGGKPVDHTVTPAEAKKIVPLDGETNVIKAFFAFIKK